MKVKEARECKGYTQQQVADMLGIKQGSYADKENGKRAFKVKELLVLEILFEVSISDMYKDVKGEILTKFNK